VRAAWRRSHDDPSAPAAHVPHGGNQAARPRSRGDRSHGPVPRLLARAAQGLVVHDMTAEGGRPAGVVAGFLDRARRRPIIGAGLVASPLSHSVLVDETFYRLVTPDGTLLWERSTIGASDHPVRYVRWVQPSGRNRACDGGTALRRDGGTECSEGRRDGVHGRTRQAAGPGRQRARHPPRRHGGAARGFVKLVRNLNREGGQRESEAWRLERGLSWGRWT
jgi:hypothetical protein